MTQGPEPNMTSTLGDCAEQREGIRVHRKLLKERMLESAKDIETVLVDMLG
jgi:hypothetical protein